MQARQEINLSEIQTKINKLFLEFCHNETRKESESCIGYFKKFTPEENHELLKLVVESYIKNDRDINQTKEMIKFLCDGEHLTDEFIEDNLPQLFFINKPCHSNSCHQILYLLSQVTSELHGDKPVIDMKHKEQYVYLRHRAKGTWKRLEDEVGKDNINYVCSKLV